MDVKLNFSTGAKRFVHVPVEDGAVKADNIVAAAKREGLLPFGQEKSVIFKLGAHRLNTIYKVKTWALADGIDVKLPPETELFRILLPERTTLDVRVPARTGRVSTGAVYAELKRAFGAVGQLFSLANGYILPLYASVLYDPAVSGGRFLALRPGIVVRVQDAVSRVRTEVPVDAPLVTVDAVLKALARVNIRNKSIILNGTVLDRAAVVPEVAWSDGLQVVNAS